MKKIMAMVLALVFSVSMMAFAAEKAAPVTSTAKTAVTKVKKAKKVKAKKVVKPAATPVAAAK